MNAEDALNHICANFAKTTDTEKRTVLAEVMIEILWHHLSLEQRRAFMERHNDE